MLRPAAAGLFWAAVFLIQKLNWGLGAPRALVLLALLLAVPLLLRLAQRGPVCLPRHLERLIAVAVIAALAAQMAYFGLQMARNPHLVDIAATTVAAGKAMLAGENPYALPLDLEPEPLADGTTFRGFKYLPGMAAAYLPFATPLGERGVLLANLLLQLGIAGLVFRLARTIGTRTAGLIAALLYLTLPLVPFQLFAKGVTDLVAVLPLLAALLLVERSAVLAGACVGLSLSAKLLPAALLVPCCLPAAPRARLSYALGIALGLLPVLFFAAWSPRAIWDNAVLFNLLRPVDTTSWLAAAPGIAGWPIRAVFVAVFLGIALYAWRRSPPLVTRCGLGLIAIFAALLSGPAIHHNYHLWWLPLYCVLVAVALARPAPAIVPAGYEDEGGRDSESQSLPSRTLAVYVSPRTLN